MKRLAVCLLLVSYSASAQTPPAEIRRATVKEHLQLFADGKDLSSPSFRYPNSQALRDWLLDHCYTADKMISGDAIVAAAKMALLDMVAKKDGRCKPTTQPR